jgi:hypothetical protein
VVTWVSKYAPVHPGEQFIFVQLLRFSAAYAWTLANMFVSFVAPQKFFMLLVFLFALVLTHLARTMSVEQANDLRSVVPAQAAAAAASGRAALASTIRALQETFAQVLTHFPGTMSVEQANDFRRVVPAQGAAAAEAPLERAVLASMNRVGKKRFAPILVKVLEFGGDLRKLAEFVRLSVAEVMQLGETFLLAPRGNGHEEKVTIVNITDSNGAPNPQRELNPQKGNTVYVSSAPASGIDSFSPAKVINRREEQGIRVFDVQLPNGEKKVYNIGQVRNPENYNRMVRSARTRKSAPSTASAGPTQGEARNHQRGKNEEASAASAAAGVEDAGVSAPQAVGSRIPENETIRSAAPVVEDAATAQKEHGVQTAQPAYRRTDARPQSQPRVNARPQSQPRVNAPVAVETGRSWGDLMPEMPDGETAVMVGGAVVGVGSFVCAAIMVLR